MKKEEYMKVYQAWCDMKFKCTNPKAKTYPRFGGAGIKISPEWADYNKFREDMLPGYLELFKKGIPSRKLTLGRIDPDKDFSADNCRWMTPFEQTIVLNPETVNFVVAQKEGEAKKVFPSLTDMAKYYGISPTGANKVLNKYGTNYVKDVIFNAISKAEYDKALTDKSFLDSLTIKYDKEAYEKNKENPVGLKPVVALQEGDCKRVFPSLTEMAAYYGIAESGVRNALHKTGNNYVKNIVFNVIDQKQYDMAVSDQDYLDSLEIEYNKESYELNRLGPGQREAKPIVAQKEGDLKRVFPSLKAMAEYYGITYDSVRRALNMTKTNFTSDIVFNTITREEYDKAIEDKKYLDSLVITFDTHSYELTRRMRMNYLESSALEHVELGEYDKSINKLEELLKIQEKNSNGADLDGTINNLAYLYEGSGNYRRTKELLERLYSIRKARLGEDAPDTLDAMKRLGNAYFYDGDYAKSREILEELYLKRKGSLADLGDDYQKLNDFRKVKKLKRGGSENMNCSCMYVLSDDGEEYYDALAKLFPLIYGELYADSLAVLNAEMEVSTDYDGEDEILTLEKGTRFLWASGKYAFMFGFEGIAVPLFPRRVKNEKGEWEEADYNGDWYTDVKGYRNKIALPEESTEM